jgi:hypothetical protein
VSEVPTSVMRGKVWQEDITHRLYIQPEVSYATTRRTERAQNTYPNHPEHATPHKLPAAEDAGEEGESDAQASEFAAHLVGEGIQTDEYLINWLGWGGKLASDERGREERNVRLSVRKAVKKLVSV